MVPLVSVSVRSYGGGTLVIIVSAVWEDSGVYGFLWCLQ